MTAYERASIVKDSYEALLLQPMTKEQLSTACRCIAELKHIMGELHELQI